MKLEDATLLNVWCESFKNNKGEIVEYYRALVSVTGEAPLQLKVRKDKFEEFRDCIGVNAELTMNIDCTPGNRQAVYLEEVA